MSVKTKNQNAKFELSPNQLVNLKKVVLKLKKLKENLVK